MPVRKKQFERILRERLAFLSQDFILSRARPAFSTAATLKIS